MGPKQVLPLLVKVFLKVEALKERSTLSRAQELEPHYQTQWVGVFEYTNCTLCRWVRHTHPHRYTQ